MQNIQSASFVGWKWSKRKTWPDVDRSLRNLQDLQPLSRLKTYTRRPRKHWPFNVCEHDRDDQHRSLSDIEKSMHAIPESP